MSAKYKSPSFLLPNEINTNTNPLNTDGNPATGTGINSLYSMDFDGSSYVDLGDSDSLSFGNSTTDSPFSISAWIYMNDATSFRILNKYNAPNYEYQFDLNSSDKLQFYIFDGSNYRGVGYDSALSINQWYHVAATYDGRGESSAQSGMVLYVNGSPVNDITYSSGSYTAMHNTAAPVNIGKIASSYANGKIDEVAIFNRALNTTEIAALYGGTSPNIYPSNLMATDLNPIAYYPLGEQAQNTGYLDPSNPGSDMSGSEWQFPNGVLQDYVMDFDSTSPGDYISAPITMLNSATQCTISFWGKKDASNKQLNVGGWESDSAGVWINWYIDGNIYLSPRGTGAGSFSLSYTQPYDNNWHHFLGVYDGSSAANCKLYLDGDLVATGSGTAPSSLPATTGDNFQIGALGSSYLSDGQISNVAVWNTAITDANQIANIYNNGSPQTTYTVTPQNWWKLNADSVYTPSAPNYTKALDFVASESDYIDCGNDNSLDITGSLSISFWIYGQTNTTHTGVITKTPNTTSISSNAQYHIQFQSSNQLRFVVTGCDLKAGTETTGTIPTVDVDSWQHFIMTWNGTDEMIVYKNGVEVATKTQSTTIVSNTSDLLIGHRQGYGYLDGQLDEVAIWNTALTSTQVSEIYNATSTNLTKDLTTVSGSNLKYWNRMGD